LKADYEKVKSSLARVEELKWDLQQLFAKYKLIEELVPEKRDIPDFITKSYFAAKQADVEIIRLEPKESTPMTYYVQDKYSLNIESTYEGIGKFIALIANLPFTALVDDVNISVKSGDTRSLSMTVKTHHMVPSARIASIQDLRKAPTGGKGPSPKVTKGGPPSIPKGPTGKPSG
jgi:Tfp pilus assembly protein PilO